MTGAMTNLFDDDNGEFFVLINAEEQYSPWPAFADVPAGWNMVHGPDTRKASLDFIEENWTGMRPKSLVEGMPRKEKEHQHEPQR